MSAVVVVVVVEVVVFVTPEGARFRSYNIYI